MKIQKIGIIGGTNGIGKAFYLFFKQQFSASKEVIVSGRTTKITNKYIIKTCDLVIFSVPISKTSNVIDSLIPYARENQIWMDFTSVKSEPVNKMEASKAEICGGHPLFGPLQNIKGQKMVLTPTRISKTTFTELKLLFSDFELLETTPQKHDEIMGVVQNLSHFSDFILGKTLKDANVDFQEILKYSSPPYRIKLDLLGRIFAQNPNLYADISAYNLSGRSMEALFMQATDFFQNKISNRDTKEIAKEFNAIRKFLGNSFCNTSWKRSQQILNFEKTLLQKEEKTEKKINIVKKYKWAIFGQAYSHTDEASFEFRKKKDSVIYFKNIFEIFDAVEYGRVEYGIVPYENSTKGSIFETLDECFDRSEIYIISATEKSISQNLLSLPQTKIEDIKRVLSHPQALAQSQRFLRRNIPSAEFQNRQSTALAAQEISVGGDTQNVAIGSKLLAEKLGLKVVFEDMQESENKTRFVIISKSKTFIFKEPTHTSFVFWFKGDSSGNLVKVLTSLSDRNINLTKLDSRRAEKLYGGYLFFVDAAISPCDFKKVLPKLKTFCGGIKILGAF